MHTDSVHAALAADAADADLSHLVVVHEVELAPDRYRSGLESRDLAWLGPVVEAADAPAGMRRHLTDLGLRIGARAGRTPLRKAAFVDLGPVRRVGHGYEMEICWRAATLAPLFPVFAGQLAIADGELRLEGWYAPPGGLIGRVADRVLLHLAARGTARWLLADLAEAVRRHEPEQP
jgi:hypothetical protein